jgi:hypothetical protein
MTETIEHEEGAVFGSVSSSNQAGRSDHPLLADTTFVARLIGLSANDACRSCLPIAGCAH